MIDLENPYIAEDLYWFVCDDNNRWLDYCETVHTDGPMSLAEYVQAFCLEDFEEMMRERRYDLALLPSGGSELRSSEPEDSKFGKDER